MRQLCTSKKAAQPSATPQRCHTLAGEQNKTSGDILTTAYETSICTRPSDADRDHG